MRGFLFWDELSLSPARCSVIILGFSMLIHCDVVKMLISLSFFHPYFGQSNCAQYAAERKEEETMCDHLISAAKHRDHVTANQLKQKILNILTNKHGAWGTVAQRYNLVHVSGCLFNYGHSLDLFILKTKCFHDLLSLIFVFCQIS